MKVAQDNYPNIFSAFQAIDADSGADTREEYEVPEKWDSSLDEIEAAIGTLNEEDQANLAIGESETMEAIAGRSEVLGKANQLFAEFFTDWSGVEGSDEEEPEPDDVQEGEGDPGDE